MQTIKYHYFMFTPGMDTNIVDDIEIDNIERVIFDGYATDEDYRNLQYMINIDNQEYKVIASKQIFLIVLPTTFNLAQVKACKASFIDKWYNIINKEL